MLDSTNKFDFYHQLAETAAQAIKNTVVAGELCRKVVERAKSIYLEMK